MRSNKHHVVITGTGRAGTTFLLQLLMRLGFDTGYSEESFEISGFSNAGSEWDIERDDAPYVIKSPWLCDTLEDVILRHDLTIDHVFIPIRNLHAAAESRRDVVRRAPQGAGPDVPGGLVYTDVADKQEKALAEKLAKLMETLAQYDIKHTLLFFPRLAVDPYYLQQKLSVALGPFEQAEFFSAFHKTSRPELIHKFAQDATTEISENSPEESKSASDA